MVRALLSGISLLVACAPALAQQAEPAADMLPSLSAPWLAHLAITLIGMMFAIICDSTSASLFLLYISLLQAGWIFLNCYLYSALIDANKLLVAAATPVSSFGSAFGASAMGYVLEHRGLPGALSLSVAALALTALLTIPFLRRGRAPAADAAGAAG